MNGFDGFRIKIPEISLPEMTDMSNWYMWSDTQFDKEVLRSLKLLS